MIPAIQLMRSYFVDTIVINEGLKFGVKTPLYEKTA